jgi:hypothetical protein
LRKFMSLFVVLLCFLCIPVVSGASCPDLTGLWVGGQLGLTIPGNVDARFQAPPYASGTLHNLSFDTGFMAGATVGYDFKKYFGVVLDYSYNALDLPRQSSSANIAGPWLCRGPYRGGTTVQAPAINGYQNTLAALMLLHYGLIPSEVFPEGRVHPYVAVGPALVFTTMGFSGGNQTSANIGLMAESGVRFYVVPQVSISAAFRYKMSAPTYEMQNVSIQPGTINTYGFLTRVAYHF